MLKYGNYGLQVNQNSQWILLQTWNDFPSLSASPRTDGLDPWRSNKNIGLSGRAILGEWISSNFYCLKEKHFFVSKWGEFASEVSRNCVWGKSGPLVSPKHWKFKWVKLGMMNSTLRVLPALAMTLPYTHAYYKILNQLGCIFLIRNSTKCYRSNDDFRDCTLTLTCSGWSESYLSCLKGGTEKTLILLKEGKLIINELLEYRVLQKLGETELWP